MAHIGQQTIAKQSMANEPSMPCISRIFPRAGALNKAGCFRTSGVMDDSNDASIRTFTLRLVSQAPACAHLLRDICRCRGFRSNSSSRSKRQTSCRRNRRHCPRGESAQCHRTGSMGSNIPCNSPASRSSRTGRISTPPSRVNAVASCVDFGKTFTQLGDRVAFFGDVVSVPSSFDFANRQPSTFGTNPRRLGP